MKKRAVFHPKFNWNILPIALLEQKVVLDQLSLHLLGHTGQGVVGALQFSVLDSLENGLHLGLHVFVVLKLLS